MPDVLNKICVLDPGATKLPVMFPAKLPTKYPAVTMLPLADNIPCAATLPAVDINPLANTLPPTTLPVVDSAPDAVTFITVAILLPERFKSSPMASSYIWLLPALIISGTLDVICFFRYSKYLCGINFHIASSC